jgi:hypothetical protein
MALLVESELLAEKEVFGCKRHWRTQTEPHEPYGINGQLEEGNRELPTGMEKVRQYRHRQRTLLRDG